MIFNNILSKICRIARRHPLISIIIVLLVIYIFSIFLITTYEHISFIDAALRIFPSFLGDLSTIELTATGVASLLGLIVNLGFIAVIIGYVTDKVLKLILKGGIIMKKVRYKNHK